MRFHITNTKNLKKFDSLIHTKEILFRILTDVLSNIGVIKSFFINIKTSDAVW